MADTLDHESSGREALATRTFVELVDSMVEDFDVIDLLTLLSSRALALLDAAAVGILLADEHGRLRVIAASAEDAELLELFQVQNDQGPCLDCYTSGTVVTTPDLRELSQWPLFAKEAVGLGFRSVCAVPLRLRTEVLGCLNLFMIQPGGLSSLDLTLAQALADVSSIAMVQDRALQDSTTREQQLQHALESRIVIEQAKGMVAERTGTDLAEAFDLIRAHARNTNLRLTDVAQGMLDRTIPVSALLARGH